MSITGTLPDLSKFVPALQSAVAARADAAADIVRQRAPVDKSPQPSRAPGTARDSITAQVEPLSDGARLTIGSDDPLMPIIIDGSSPHVIVPAGAKSLRFVVGGGGVVFAKHVDHPGTAPNPFAQDATEEILSLMQDAIAEAAQAVLT